MLSRTADSLYWLGRYVERAENTARLLDGALHMSLLPIPTEERSNLWRNLFPNPAAIELFERKYGTYSEQPIIEFMTLDPENPTSVHSCMFAARENTRSVRHVLTTEISQSINQAWMDTKSISMADVADRGTQNFLDSIKERAHHFKGVVYGTMRRGEPFLFWELGTALERAENTARLILARSDNFHRAARRDDGFDYYRWGTFLRSANSYSAYRQLYGDVDPVLVADLLILNTQIPRSLLSCIEDATEVLRTLKREAQCAEMAERLASEIRTMRLERVLRSGLTDFLIDFQKQVHALSDQIRADFIMVR